MALAQKAKLFLHLAPPLVTLAIVDRAGLSSRAELATVGVALALSAAFDVRARWRDIDAARSARMLLPVGGTHFYLIPIWTLLGAGAIGCFFGALRSG